MKGFRGPPPKALSRIPEKAHAFLKSRFMERKVGTSGESLGVRRPGSHGAKSWRLNLAPGASHVKVRVVCHCGFTTTSTEDPMDLYGMADLAIARAVLKEAGHGA